MKGLLKYIHGRTSTFGLARLWALFSYPWYVCASNFLLNLLPPATNTKPNRTKNTNKKTLFGVDDYTRASQVVVCLLGEQSFITIRARVEG